MIIVQLGSGSMYDKELAGKRMQECRKRKGVTQEVMGDAIGFSRTKVSNLETARNDICMTDAVQVCDYLGVGLDTIFYCKEMNTNDFLTLSNAYFTNKTIPENERRDSLRDLLKYL